MIIKTDGATVSVMELTIYYDVPSNNVKAIILNNIK